MMKQGVGVLLICLLILSSCSWGKDQLADINKMDSMSDEEKNAFMKGSIVEDHYKNDFFGLELVLPKSWVVLTEEEMMRLMQTGEDIASESDATFDMTEVEILNLMGIFKHPFNEVVAMNPNLYISAERLDETMNIGGSETYMEQAYAGIEHLGETIVFDKAMDAQNIQEKIYTKSHATIDLGYMVIYQVHYVTLTRGYALNIIATYMEDEDLETIEKMLGL